MKSYRARLMMALEIFPPQKFKIINAKDLWWKNTVNKTAEEKIFILETPHPDKQGAYFHCRDIRLSLFITKEDLYVQIRKGHIEIIP